jgi:eukaryotic-like serine/threonine-protein kinase
MIHGADREFVALQSALAGQYSLERELGRGGMGIVYLAREVQLDRPVAIKLLPPALAVRPELRDRFMREARVAAKLSHPNIIPIFRVTEVGEFVFFVMAYVEGETLGQRLRAGGPLPPSGAARIIREVAWALAYAHARGIIHRDIKPDNILLERETGRAVVTDFGIAHIGETSGVTEVGQVMGTAQFMSPEQASGEPLDGRSDLYALGVVGYLTLAGRLPFGGSTVPAVLTQHLTQPPEPLVAVTPAVPRQLARAVDRCLAKDPADRFPNGEALAEAISLATEPRREIPAPVRVWLTKGSAMRAVYVIWMPFAILSAFSDPGWPAVIGFGGPILFHAAFRLHHTRRVLAAGYGLDDLRRGLATFTEQRREELTFDVDREPPLPARILRVLTYVGLATVAATAAAMVFVPDRLPGVDETISFFMLASILTLLGGMLGIAYPGRRISATDQLAELRLKFWNSPLGDRLVKLASIRLNRRAVPAQLTNRPTEIALGLAASDLFAALPKTVQHRLRELPSTVGSLEREAQAMRKRVDELNEELAVIGGRLTQSVATRERAPVSSEKVAAAREAATRRLAEAVAALETIRLDLLRLHAGTGTVESLTAALDAARQIGAEVDRMVAGQLEADAAVRTPP